MCVRKLSDAQFKALAYVERETHSGPFFAASVRGSIHQGTARVLIRLGLIRHVYQEDTKNAVQITPNGRETLATERTLRNLQE